MVTIQVYTDVLWPIDGVGYTVSGEKVDLNISPEIKANYSFILCGPKATYFLEGMWSVWNLESNAFIEKGVTRDDAIKLAEYKIDCMGLGRFSYLVYTHRERFQLHLKEMWKKAENNSLQNVTV